MENIIASLLVYLFPIGLILIIGAGMLEKHIPESICGYMSLVGLVFVWGPIIAGVPFMIYHFVVIPIAFQLGFELPSFFW